VGKEAHGRGHSGGNTANVSKRRIHSKIQLLNSKCLVLSVTPRMRNWMFRRTREEKGVMNPTFLCTLDMSV
jgi:hypothetical protein